MTAQAPRAIRRPPAPPRLGTSLEVLVTASGVLLVAVDLVRAATATGQYDDFGWLLGGAHAVSRGMSPYVGFREQVFTFGGFAYMPLIAWLLQPLAALPVHTAEAVWTTLGVIATVVGLQRIAPLVMSAELPRRGIALVLAGAFTPAYQNYFHGQVNPFVLLALASAMVAWCDDREWRCGLWIGVAAVLKVSPIVLLALCVKRRWWRALGAGIGVGVGALVLGIAVTPAQDTREWVTQVLPSYRMVTAWPPIQSWMALVTRAADPQGFAPHPDPVLYVAGVVLSAAGVVTAALLVRSVRTRPERAAEFAIGMAAMLLATPFAWTAQSVALLPLVLAGISRGIVGHDPRVGLPALAALIAVWAVSLVLAGVAAPTVAEWSTSPWWRLEAQLFSLPLLAIVLAAVSLACATLRAPAATSE